MKQRRLLSLFAAALLGLTFTAFPPAALEPPEIVAEAATSSSLFEYSLNGSKYLNITKYNGSDSSVTIPREHEGKEIVSINKSAFENNKYVKYVTIQDNVKYIHERAFANCTKLKRATIQGRVMIDSYAFYNCSTMTNIIMNEDSWTYSGSNHALNIFTNCSSLKQINSQNVLQYSTVSGYQKPKLRQETQSSNAPTRKIIKTFFRRSENVGFIDQYCTELCNWIRNTQTRPWMSDAAKARQYHDWLMDHCLTGNPNNPECHLYSSVFLSCGLGIRGTEKGEAVCSGFAKAYTMLLHASGIESYVVGERAKVEGLMAHAWNLVKLDGKYYHCDTYKDNQKSNYHIYNPNNGLTPYPMYNGYYYCNFMLATSELPTVYQQYEHVVNPANNEIDPDSGLPGYVHPYASYPYTVIGNGAPEDTMKRTAQDALFAKCTTKQSVQDANQDGIPDGDWNLDGEGNRRDSVYYNAACWKMDRTLKQNDMWNYFNKLIKVWEMSPDELYDEYMYD